MIRRTVGLVLEYCAAIVAGMIVIAALAAWRLSSGPIALDFLTPYIEEALSAEDGSIAVELDQTVLTWAGWDRNLDLRARGVRAVRSDGTVVATVPELSVNLSLKALARGMVAPTSLDAIGLRVRLVRTVEGGIEFGLGDEAGVSDELMLALLADLLVPPGPDRPMGYLLRVSVLDADLAIYDRRSGLSWRVPEADIILERDVLGIRGNVAFDIDVGGRRAHFDASGLYESVTGTIDLDVAFSGLEPAVFAPVAPALAPLAALTLPLEGTVMVSTDIAGRLDEARFELIGGPGRIALPDFFPEGLEVELIQGRGRLSENMTRLVVDNLLVDLGGPTVIAAGEASVIGGEIAITADLAVSDLPVDDLERYWPAGVGANARRWIAGHLSGGMVREARATLEARGAGGGIAGLEVESISGAIRYDGMTVDYLPGLPKARNVEGTASFDDGRIDITAKATMGKGLVVEASTITLTGLDGADPRAAFDLVIRGSLDDSPVDLGGPTAVVAGEASMIGGEIAITADLAVSDLPVDDLERYWPAGVGAGARRWIASHLSGGMVREARATLEAHGAGDGTDGLRVESISGEILFDGMTVDYLPGLPKAHDVAGTASFDDGRIEATAKGTVGKELVVEANTITLTGLGGADPRAAVDLVIRGPLEDALEVVDHLPLGFVGKLGLDPAQLSGRAAIRLKLALPLNDDLDLDQIELAVAANLRAVAWREAFYGLDITDGDLTLKVEEMAMAVEGRISLAGAPVDFAWTENFTQGAAFRRRLALKGRLGGAVRQALGFEGEPYLEGPVFADLVLTDHGDGTSELAAVLDLGEAVLNLPELGWQKPSGVAGSARFRLALVGQRPAALTELAVDAGDLTVRGRATFGADGAKLEEAEITHLAYGATEVEAMVAARPEGGFEIRLKGPSLDISHFLEAEEAEEEEEEEEGEEGEMMPITVSADVERLWIGPERHIAKVTGAVSHDGEAWQSIVFQGELGDGKKIDFQFVPEGQGRKLSITSEDAGAVLRVFDLSDNLIGGRLEVVGVREGAGAGQPLKGTAVIEDYQLIEASVLVRFLTLASLTGILDTLRGKGISFDRFEAPFTLADDVIEVADASAKGSELGLTFEGTIDLESDTADIRGTIVPAYTINSLLGRIPLLGDILIGEEGGGLFAATYTVTGSLDDPDIMVNPLAVLTPGFLRKVFDIFEVDKGAAQDADTETSDETK
ncbi:MAG: AsmA-like C-terminal domain-containing protein [Proteobacteria bacterium]|nr:AsmA-like C-terminal domain-containing protein [Pseudomonadota bacterium]